MTLLEKKVDVIARALLENDLTDRSAYLANLSALMKQTEKPAESTEKAVRQILLELGVPDRIIGYEYCVVAIRETALHPNIIRNLIGGLYPLIAQSCGTTVSKAERAIRVAVEIAWDRGDYDVLTNYFGGTVSREKGRPTNGEFIARCANIVREMTA